MTSLKIGRQLSGDVPFRFTSLERVNMKLQPMLCTVKSTSMGHVCMVGTSHAEMEWLLTESKGPCNLINDLLAFELLILYISYKAAV